MLSVENKSLAGVQEGRTKPKKRNREMKIILKFFMLLLFIIHLQCSESLRCAPHGPHVRFPFQISGKKAEGSGFPSPAFQLSCSEDETLLQLPNSVKLSVRKIDYASQVMHLTDPDPHQPCLPKLMIHLNLSASPFRFADKNSSFAVLKCSSNSRGRNLEWQNPCGRDLDYEVRRLYSRIDISLVSCTMLRTISAPDMVFSSRDYMLRLAWDIPSCRRCEGKGQSCRLSNHTSNSHTNETECYRTPGQIKELQKEKLIIGGVFAFLIFASAVFFFYCVCNFDKLDKE